ncbi:MAG: acyltransferase family protein [Muribaculaceae bacterium]
MKHKVCRKSQSGRLASLDVLRGFTLFMLVGLQPVLVMLLATINSDAFTGVLAQLDHEVWQGLRVWDMVMPLFLFMSGTSMPFSLAKYVGGNAGKKVWLKIARRVLLLWLLGMVVQGNLLTFNWEQMMFYTNTLQAIAAGYLIAACAILMFGFRPMRLALCVVALLAMYCVPMLVVGDYTPEGNLANLIDAAVMGSHRGDPSYTWILSSFTFGGTVLLGAIAGCTMKQKSSTPGAAFRLLCTGVLLILLALLMSGVEPIIKRIWTGSFTLLSGGICYLLMAVAYWLIDVRGGCRWLLWLRIYGMNSIAAYMLGEAVNFRSVVDSVSYGLQPLLGEYYTVWQCFGNFAIVFAILYALHKAGVYLRV